MAAAFQMDLTQFDEAFDALFSPSDRTVVLETIDHLTHQLDGLARRLRDVDAHLPGQRAGDPMGQATFDLLVTLGDQLSMAAGKAGAAAHDAGTHHAWGFASAAALAAHRTRAHPAHTHRLVRRARTEAQFPHFDRARQEQRISCAHLDPLGSLWHNHPSVRDLLRRDETVLLDAALALSPPEFAKACRHWLALADPDAADAAYLKRHLDRGITFIRRLDGSLVFSGEADPIRGEAILDALEREERVLATADRLARRARAADPNADATAATELLPGATSGGDPDRTARQRRLDALCSALAAGAAGAAGAASAPGARRPEPLVELVVGEGALLDHLQRSLVRDLALPTSPDGLTPADDPRSPADLGELLHPGFGTRTRRGYPVPTAAAVAGMIHGRIVTVTTGAEGAVIDAGRTRRLFSDSQRRLSRLEHTACVYPGCTHPAHHCQIDHLVDWALGGETNLSNGAPMCPSHHGLKNDGFFTVDRDQHGRLRFTRFDGTLIT